jgi:superfamily II DNA or RNA helicase
MRIQFEQALIGSQLKVTCPKCNYSFIYTVTEDEISIDLTRLLDEYLAYPEIQSFPVSLVKPSNSGKQYKENEKENIQSAQTIINEKCIHGLPKSWCGICIKRELDKKGPINNIKFDPFDLIFPILQPPLGDNFDNPVVMPTGENLYKFQKEGIVFLGKHKQALLADEMGLGKSIQAIMAIRLLLRKGEIANGLILCPKSVLTDWKKKFEYWAPEIRVVKVSGPKEQRQICWESPANVYLTTYETLRQDISSSLAKIEDDIELESDSLFDEIEFDEKLNKNNDFAQSYNKDIARTQFDFVILDEIQKIKNPTAKVTKAVSMIDSPIRWGLSGTPLENRIEDLISIFAYLKPGLLHYYDAKNIQKVKTEIEPYFKRRLIKDVLPELPEKVYDDIWLELSPAQKEAYERAEQEGIFVLNKQGDLITIPDVLGLITKLKQICNVDPVTGESCKVEHLLKSLEEITEQGDKALIFSQYPEKTLKLIKTPLDKFNPLIYDGSLSDTQRDQIINNFQDREDNKILLMSVKAGGTGLTLTKANHVYHYDLWWNPSVAKQAEGRVIRIGQKKSVFVYYLLTIGTIEERIQDLLKRKQALFDSVVDDLSDTRVYNALTEEELFGLFGLTKTGTKQKKDGFTNGSIFEQLQDITPPKFEEIIAQLYKRMGYNVNLTPQTRDGGIDVYAKRISESGTEFIAIQCKHYPNRTVGVNDARALYGAIQDKMDITKAVMLTSGTFSRECQEFAKGKRIELFDGAYVCGLLEKYNIPI